MSRFTFFDFVIVFTLLKLQQYPASEDRLGDGLQNQEHQEMANEVHVERSRSSNANRVNGQASMADAVSYHGAHSQSPFNVDTLVVRDQVFSVAELCAMLGHCGLVLRHVEKSGKGEVLHFSSI